MGRPPKKPIEKEPLTIAPNSVFTPKDVPAKNDALANVRKMVLTVFKKSGFSDPIVKIDENTFTEPMDHIPTGSIKLDYLIGGKLNKYGIAPCPGLPKGRISNIYGQESSGKTTVALTVAANVCAAGGSVCYIDWENAIIPNYAQTLGVPIGDDTRFLLFQPETLEQGMSIAWAAVKAGVDLVIFDSVGAGVPQTQDDKAQSILDAGESGQIGLLARKWGNALIKYRAKINKTGTHIIGISQNRTKINTGFMQGKGDPTTQQGGAAWKYYSDVRINLKRTKTLKEEQYVVFSHKKEEVATTNIIQAHADKCKVSAAQGCDVDFYINFGEGIDDLRSVIEFGSNHGIIHKSGAKYSYESPVSGLVIESIGLAKFKKDLKESEGILEELYHKVRTGMFSGTEALIVGEESEDDVDLSEMEDFFETAKTTIKDDDLDLLGEEG